MKKEDILKKKLELEKQLEDIEKKEKRVKQLYKDELGKRIYKIVERELNNAKEKALEGWEYNTTDKIKKVTDEVLLEFERNKNEQ